MTDIDLSAHLPDLDAATAADNAEFPGCPVPTPGGATGATLTRQTPTQCRGCPLTASDHKVWQRVKVTAAGGHKPMMAERVTRKNSLVAHIEKTQGVLLWQSLVAHGVYDGGLTPIGYANATRHTFSWPLVSISGNTATLRYTAETDNPAGIEWAQYTFTQTPSTPGDPRLTSTTIRNALPPRGIIKFGGGVLMDHPGFVMRKVICSDAIAEDETFQIVCDCESLGAADEAMDDMDLTATVEVYLAAPETWQRVRRAHPFYGELTELIVEAASFPGDDEFELVTAGAASCAIALPTQGAFFQCLVQDSGGFWTDITATAAGVARLRIEHDGASAHKTYCDLAGLIDTALAVSFAYYAESAADTATHCGQDRCAHSTEDLTGSWGVTVGDSKWYCGQRENLLILEAAGGATGAKATTALGAYRPACRMYGVCPLFAADREGNPFSHAVWEQLLYSYPWKMIEYRLSEGVVIPPTVSLTRAGVPSLLSLSHPANAIPDGSHNLVLFPQIGGWPQAGTFTISAGFDTLAYQRGLEWLNFRTLSWPLFGDTDTWPEYGPAGGNEDRAFDVGGDATDGTTEGQIIRSMVGSGPRNVRLYDLAVYGETLGTFLRCGTRQFEFWFPRLVHRISTAPEGNEEYRQDRDDGYFLKGYWKADFTQQAAEDANTVYYAMLKINHGIRDDRTRDEAMDAGGPTITVSSYSYNNTTKQLTIDCVNGLETASTPLVGAEPGTEVTTRWRQRGKVVADPEFLRVKNWQSNAGLGPDRAFVHRGMALVFDSASLASRGKVYNRKFWIVGATAGTGAVQTWKPTGGTTETMIVRSAPYMWFFAYATTGETALDSGSLQISVTRNSGATELTAYAEGWPKPYPNGGLPVDTYYAYEGLQGAQAGMFVQVSQLNATDVEAENTLLVAITTTGGSYGGEIEVNPSPTQSIVTFTRMIASLEDVTVTVRKEDGDEVELAPMESLPDNGADWTDPNLYYREAYGTTGVAIYTHTAWAHDELVVTAIVSDEEGQSEAEFYDEKVGIHGTYPEGALPADHESYANKGDQIIIQDENDAIKSLIDASVSLTGLSFTTRLDPIAHYADETHAPEVRRNEYGAEAETADDTLTIATDYIYYGAQGEIWFKSDPVTEGQCLIANLYASQWKTIPRAADFHNLRSTLERTMGSSDTA